MIRHGWLIGLASLFFAVSTMGCAQKPGWQSFPVKIYADSSITSNPARESDLRDAMSFWEDKEGGRALFDYQGTWEGGAPYSGSPANVTSIQANVIMFQSPWQLGSNLAGLTMTSQQGTEINGAVIFINGSVGLCVADCAGQGGANSERKDFAHELGHFLGLQHVQDRNNIMYPVLQPGGSLSDVTIDQTALDTLTN